MPEIEENQETVDVTEIIARIEELEKTGASFEEKYKKLIEENATIISRVVDCEDSIDEIAKRLARIDR